MRGSEAEGGCEGGDSKRTDVRVNLHSMKPYRCACWSVRCTLSGQPIHFDKRQWAVSEKGLPSTTKSVLRESGHGVGPQTGADMTMTREAIWFNTSGPGG